MKKVIIGVVLGVAAASAFAQVTNQRVCAGAGQGGATNVQGNTNGSLFVRTAFTATCSTNTVMAYSDNGVRVIAGAASTKGQSGFAGSTDGGAVTNVGNCNNGKACGTVDATTTYVGGTPLTVAATLGNTN